MALKRFATIGMIHVRTPPGPPPASLSVQQLVDKACEEAEVYKKYDLDAILLENRFELQHMKAQASGPDVTAIMANIATEVRRLLPAKIDCGLRIVAGQNHETMAAAVAANLQFVRAEEFVCGHVGDKGYIESYESSLLRNGKPIEEGSVKVWCDFKKMNPSNSITAGVSICEPTKVAESFLADSLILTGNGIGVSPLEYEITQVRSSLPEMPIILGSGVTHNNVVSLSTCGADGAIVGSHFKQDGQWQNDLCPQRIETFMNKIKQMKSNSLPIELVRASGQGTGIFVEPDVFVQFVNQNSSPGHFVAGVVTSVFSFDEVMNGTLNRESFRGEIRARLDPVRVDAIIDSASNGRYFDPKMRCDRSFLRVKLSTKVSYIHNGRLNRMEKMRWVSYDDAEYTRHCNLPKKYTIRKKGRSVSAVKLPNDDRAGTAGRELPVALLEKSIELTNASGEGIGVFVDSDVYLASNRDPISFVGRVLTRVFSFDELMNGTISGNFPFNTPARSRIHQLDPVRVEAIVNFAQNDQYFDTVGCDRLVLRQAMASKTFRIKRGRTIIMDKSKWAGYDEDEYGRLCKEYRAFNIPRKIKSHLQTRGSRTEKKESGSLVNPPNDDRAGSVGGNIPMAPFKQSIELTSASGEGIGVFVDPDVYLASQRNPVHFVTLILTRVFSFDELMNGSLLGKGRKYKLDPVRIEAILNFAQNDQYFDQKMSSDYRFLRRKIAYKIRRIKSGRANKMDRLKWAGYDEDEYIRLCEEYIDHKNSRKIKSHLRTRGSNTEEKSGSKGKPSNDDRDGII